MNEQNKEQREYRERDSPYRGRQKEMKIINRINGKTET